MVSQFIIERLENKGREAAVAYVESTRLMPESMPPLPGDSALTSLYETSNNLIFISDALAQINPIQAIEREIRWVPAARMLLRQCAKRNLVPFSIDRTMFFSDKNIEDQRYWFNDMVLRLPEDTDINANTYPSDVALGKIALVKKELVRVNG